MSAQPNEGWFGPQSSRRFHYFADDGRSLCGKWFQFATPQSQGLDWDTAIGPARGDCTACARALAKRAPHAS